VKSSDEAASRPRTKTGNLRVVKLMMEIVGDKAWSKPGLIVDKDEPERVCVAGKDGTPGVCVAFFREDDVWLILLPDETIGEPPQYAPIGELPTGDERWAERALYALKLQRIADGGQ
jgi:hypothetical protein